MRIATPFRLSAVGLLAVFAAACADAPTSPEYPGGPSFILNAGAVAVGDVVAADHGRGLAVVCSYGAAGNFTIVSSVAADNIVADIAAGTCEVVAERLTDVNSITATMNPVGGQTVTGIAITTGTANTGQTYPNSVANTSGAGNSGSSIYGLENGTLIEFTSTLTPPPPPPGGGEGCTPGYWKQAHHFDSWTAPYTPGTLFSTVFADAFPGLTLQQVAAQGGGGLKALGRHTVAALLNAASSGVDYDYSVADVIADFNAAFASGDYETQKNLFAVANEQGCPLN
jgi:hypothetical protein